MGNNQIEMVNIETLVAKNYTYRKLKELIDFKKLTRSVSIEEKELGATGYIIIRLILRLIRTVENLN